MKTAENPCKKKLDLQSDSLTQAGKQRLTRKADSKIIRTWGTRHGTMGVMHHNENNMKENQHNPYPFPRLVFKMLTSRLILSWVTLEDSSDVS